MNRFLPHVLVIPEDHADEQIANGFVLHDQVKTMRIQVVSSAKGWPGVLEVFRKEYVPYLRNNQHGHVVLLIDFDGQYENRRNHFDAAVPDDLKNRTFVVGAKETPQHLRSALGKGLEDIGRSLAEDCFNDTVLVWGHDDLEHNEPDRLRLVQSVRSILFED